MSKKLTIEGMEDVLKWLTPSRDIHDPIYGPVHKAMASTGKVLEAQIKANLKENGSIGARGQLINAINSSNPVLEEGALVVRVGAGGVPYAPAVEYGTEPHRIPWSDALKGGNLERWVDKKGMAGTYATSGRRIGGRERVFRENVEVAKRVRVGIQKDGTRAHPFFYKALRQQEERIKEEFAAALHSIVEKMLGKLR